RGSCREGENRCSAGGGAYHRRWGHGREITRCPMRALALLMAGWLVGAGVVRADKAPEPLPDDVVKAWKEAGAEAGWLGPDLRDGTLHFEAKREDLGDAARAVPAFRVEAWTEGAL